MAIALDRRNDLFLYHMIAVQIAYEKIEEKNQYRGSPKAKQDGRNWSYLKKFPQVGVDPNTGKVVLTPNMSYNSEGAQPCGEKRVRSREE